MAGLWLMAAAVPAQAQEVPRLWISRPTDASDWMHLRSSFHSNAVLGVESSTNWVDWMTIGTLHDTLRQYPDFDGSHDTVRLYRLRTLPREVTNDWKNEIVFPDEPFLSPPGQQIRWVKFAILLKGPRRVHYQDSTKFPFHYDFATARLDPFVGLDRTEFDLLTLYRANQRAVLGAVLYPPEGPADTFVEYGIQFVGQDVYTPDQIRDWFELVRATVYAPDGAGVFYMPAFEQGEMARTNGAAFVQRKVPVSSLDRWISVNHVYSTGWALGTLKYFPGTEIAAAFADGRLLPGDVLLTDGVPAETPLVAGIITLTPSSPNSHTALLARSFGIPFVYLPQAEEQARVEALAGHRVILRATVSYDESVVKVIDVEGALDPSFESDLLKLKEPPPIAYLPKQTYGGIVASTETLVPSDIQYFGGKAANFGLLRQWVPTNSPAAIAFSFDLWDAFLDQPVSGGQTLRATIASRLAPYTHYPPDIPSLKPNLAVIRDLIAKSATFTAEQEQAILAALTVFNPQRKIRFRSSTNVEDSEQFTGAGLYDSYSGCLLDDLDGDDTGPSLCDPEEPEERGVFRAIQKVYASFYNDNAFLERLRHGVDESSVGMGVLVHHSFPDEEELANGVATLRFTFTPSRTNVAGEIVSQVGAESVTNPDGSALPEEISAARFNQSTSLSITRRSSRVPLGGFVMDWQDDYRAFLDLFGAIGFGYQQFFPGKQGFYLDFEFKKDVNLGLVVKQVREIPGPVSTNKVVAFLINEPASYTIRQGEFGTVFGNHRLKSRWTLQTTNVQMTASNLAFGIYTDGVLEYIDQGVRHQLVGPPASWPNASNAPSGTVSYWTTGSGPDVRWQLDTALTPETSGSQPPILTQQDCRKTVTVTYPEAMPTVDYSGVPEVTTNDTVELEIPPVLSPGALLQNRSLGATGISIESSFYWPKPVDLAAGYTAPLVHFVETRISGLTASTLVLTNYFSQTYRPGHHNFSEEFIFEPRLEPGLAPDTLAELSAANIQLIYVLRNFGPTNVVRILGLDQTFRDP